MIVHNSPSFKPSFGAILYETDNATPRQKDIITKIALDRKYFSSYFLKNMQKQNIDVFIKTNEDGLIDVALIKSAGRDCFVPKNDNNEYMTESFDSDDALVMDSIGKYIDKIKAFMDNKMYNNRYNVKQASRLEK